MDKITSTLTWHPINDNFGSFRPDADAEVLIYDGYLDDTVKGSLDYNEKDEAVWLDQTTGDPLPDPQFWTDVPYPGDKA